MKPIYVIALAALLSALAYLFTSRPMHAAYGMAEGESEGAPPGWRMVKIVRRCPGKPPQTEWRREPIEQGERDYAQSYGRSDRTGTTIFRGH